jgi:hypothetical protein
MTSTGIDQRKEISALAKISVSQGLFVAGICCFLLVFLFPEAKRPLVLAGGAICDVVFFRVLADNYRKRAPILTTGGILQLEKRPRTYKFVYGLMAFLGIFFLIVLISITAFLHEEGEQRLGFIAA